MGGRGGGGGCVPYNAFSITQWGKISNKSVWPKRAQTTRNFESLLHGWNCPTFNVLVHLEQIKFKICIGIHIEVMHQAMLLSMRQVIKVGRWCKQYGFYSRHFSNDSIIQFLLHFIFNINVKWVDISWRRIFKVRATRLKNFTVSAPNLNLNSRIYS